MPACPNFFTGIHHVAQWVPFTVQCTVQYSVQCSVQYRVQYSVHYSVHYSVQYSVQYSAAQYNTAPARALIPPEIN